jgi:hypothetical protein
VELTQEKSKIIKFHGDKNIEFEVFGMIIRDARNAGVENFIFATKQTASSDYSRGFNGRADLDSLFIHEFIEMFLVHDVPFW